MLNSESSSPPNYYALLTICCGIVLGCYFGTYMRFPVVPLFAQSLGADTTEVGLINRAFLLAAGALSLPLGLVAGLLGMKRLALAGLLMLAASSFLLAVSSTPHHLIWIYLFSGIGPAPARFPRRLISVTFRKYQMLKAGKPPASKVRRAIFPPSPSP